MTKLEKIGFRQPAESASSYEGLGDCVVLDSCLRNKPLESLREDTLSFARRIFKMSTKEIPTNIQSLMDEVNQIGRSWDSHADSLLEREFEDRMEGRFRLEALQTVLTKVVDLSQKLELVQISGRDYALMDLFATKTASLDLLNQLRTFTLESKTIDQHFAVVKGITGV
jgi:hypothetical protein